MFDLVKFVFISWTFTKLISYCQYCTQKTRRCQVINVSKLLLDRYDNKTDKQVVVWEKWVVGGEVLR